MKKILVLAGVIFGFLNLSWGQLSFPGTPASFQKEQLSWYVPTVDLPALDIEKLWNEDLAAKDKGTPLRIGVNHQVTLNMYNSGKWDHLPNGERIWRMGVRSEGALALHFNFSQFEIPKGAEVYIYSPDHQYVAGMYDRRSTLEDGAFYAQDIPGDEMIIEYYQPASVEGTPQIEISSVGHTYKDGSNYKGFHGTAVGDCHINTACPEVEPWRDQVNSVVLIKITVGNDIYMCSGAMINNTRQDNTPYVFTAEHCYEPGAAWRFYFGYESTTCESIGGSYNKVAIGGEVVAKESASDFMLLKITGNINENYKPNIFLAGWNRNTGTPSVGAAIHHPGGDYKKYSKPRLVSPGTGYYAKYWRVNWLLGDENKGTTEQGSSGSPLFDANGYIVGSLCCGTSSCEYIDQYNVGPSGADHYGRFSYSWTNNNTTISTRKLQPWLDPDDLGNILLAGRYWNHTVGVEQYKEIQTFKVLPNPSEGSVTFKDLELKTTATCSVYDPMGRLLISITLHPDDLFQFDWSHLSNGLYLVEIQSQQQHYRAKMLIAK